MTVRYLGKQAWISDSIAIATLLSLKQISKKTHQIRFHYLLFFSTVKLLYDAQHGSLSEITTVPTNLISLLRFASGILDHRCRMSKRLPFPISLFVHK